MRITIRVRPGSAHPGVGGEHAGALVVRVSARAVDGKATEAALAAVAAHSASAAAPSRWCPGHQAAPRSSMSSLATRASSRTCSPSRATAEAGLKGAEAARLLDITKTGVRPHLHGTARVASRRPGAWLMLLCVINSEDTARRPPLSLPNRIVSDRRDSNRPVRHRSVGYRAGSPRKPGDGLRRFRMFRVTPGAARVVPGIRANTGQPSMIMLAQRRLPAGTGGVRLRRGMPIW